MLNYSYLEIDKNLFYQNLKNIYDYIGMDKKICLVVKSNAYGHGLIEIAQLAEKKGIEYLAVATINEGIALRKHHIKTPILLLLPFLQRNIPMLFEYDLIPLLTHLEFLDDLILYAKKFNKTLPLHIKIDTGMNRSGFHPDLVLYAVEKIQASENIIIKGLATHFSLSNYKDNQQQIALFKNTVEKIQSVYKEPLIIHAASTGIVNRYENSYFDMIRIGIGAYGYPRNFLPGIYPIMSLKSKIIYTKRIKKGEKVSYGGSWEATSDTNIALLPIGYGDGIFRALSNKGNVKINGRYYPIVGMICMNAMIINTGNDVFPLETDVMIFGNDDILDAEVLAKQVNSISYEILTNMKENFPRVYI